MANHIANKGKNTQSLSYVELRSQKRIEQIRMIRALLVPGDQMIIKNLCGKSIRAVNDTLSEKYPLFSKPVIEAALTFLFDNGRIDSIPEIAE